MTIREFCNKRGLNEGMVISLIANCKGVVCHNCPLYQFRCSVNKLKAEENSLLSEYKKIVEKISGIDPFD